jgi:protein-L-isoaspartate(D-aspartate) O-methyltransferase
MVRRHLAARGILDRRVLAVMARLPRERFLPPDLRDQAYADSPLPIGYDQTISQPYMVALMTQEARLTRRSTVLEVGTGTGYHTAVLAHLGRHVWSMERIEPLSRRAARALQALGVRNATLLVGDGARGYPPAAPYDAIVVAAAAPAAPAALLEQLAVGGRLVIPLGDPTLQQLTVLERTAIGFRERTAGSCRFVPLVGEEGTW